MKNNRCLQFSTAVVAALALSPALAEIDKTGPIPLTAEEAFDAVATGCIDGVCYGVGKVVLVDVRTQSELDFQGGPAKVDQIVLKAGCEGRHGHYKERHGYDDDDDRRDWHGGSCDGEEKIIVPDLGKAKVTKNGRYLEFAVNGKKRRIKVDKIKEVETSLIAKLAECSVYIPGEGADEGEFVPDQKGFSADMAAIADEMDAVGHGPNVAITMCNSGGRSTQCPLRFLDLHVQQRFAKWYEIDAAGDIYITPPEFQLFVELGLPLPPPGIHMATLGGFSGSDYGGDYNGIIGWPERRTQKQPVTGWKTFDPETGDVRFASPSGPSVSWKDSGLPIYIPKVMCNLSAAP